MGRSVADGVVTSGYRWEPGEVVGKGKHRRGSEMRMGERGRKRERTEGRREG